MHTKQNAHVLILYQIISESYIDTYHSCAPFCSKYTCLLYINNTEYTCLLYINNTEYTCLLYINNTEYTCLLFINNTEYTCLLYINNTKYTCLLYINNTKYTHLPHKMDICATNLTTTTETWYYIELSTVYDLCYHFVWAIDNDCVRVFKFRSEL